MQSDEPDPSAVNPIVRVLLLDAGSGAGAHLEGQATHFVVHHADGIGAAVEAVGTSRVDCAVLDLTALSLPHDVQSLQAADPTMGLVVVSGAADDDATVRALALGVDDHLTVGHIDPVLASRAVRFAIARKRAEGARIRQALQDPLTGLPNRLALEEQLGVALQRAERRGTRIAVVFVELTGLEAAAAAHGRAFADEALIEVGDRLCEVARDSDTVGRLDGDLMVVVCEDLELEISVRRLANRIEEVLAAPVRRGAAVADLAPRFGFASGTPTQTPSQLLRRRSGSTAELAFGP